MLVSHFKGVVALIFDSMVFL